MNLPYKHPNGNLRLTFNITDPDVYSFEATGVAVAEYTETAYTITANYMIGNAEFTDIIIEGAINNGVWDFENKTIEILFQNGDIEFIEYILFSLPDVTMEDGEATGTGSVTIENGDTGDVETGNLEFTASQVIPNVL